MHLKRNETFYDTLKVPHFSSIDVIKISYRKLVKEYHPDISDDIDSEMKMINLNEAYSFLSNSKLKFEYDQILRSTLKNKDVYLSYNLSLEEIYDGKVSLRYRIYDEEQEITFGIPYDIKSGHKIVFEGYGENFGYDKPGNLIVEFDIEPHPFFEYHYRSGLLTANYSVDVFDLLLGSEKSIMMVDGYEAVIDIQKGSQPDTSILIPERGMIDADGNRGDVLITLKVQLPILSEDEESAIRKIRNRQNNY